MGGVTGQYSAPVLRSAHLVAVLMVDSECSWTHMAVPENILAFFKARKDNQIMGLELLSISLGLSSFEQLLRKRRVVIHSEHRL